MPLYRVLRNLSRDGEIIPRGTISALAQLRPASIEAHLRYKQVALVYGPPLDALPGWKTRARKLARHSVITVEDFLLAEDEQLGEWLGVKQATIDRYKRELETHLS